MRPLYALRFCLGIAAFLSSVLAIAAVPPAVMEELDGYDQALVVAVYFLAAWALIYAYRVLRSAIGDDRTPSSRPGFEQNPYDDPF